MITKLNHYISTLDTHKMNYSLLWISIPYISS